MPSVVYIEAVQNKYLYELSKKANEYILQSSQAKCNRFYMPLQWIPHITIGKQLDKEQMRKGFEILQDLFNPIHAKIVRFSLSKPKPYEEIEVIELEK